ncbi:MAG: MMPL family transporter [Candidatus Marinimicrobia bacterium]|nr:MMPL family transporter [Candidatus Neomarinimicrobiota bacterium]
MTRPENNAKPSILLLLSSWQSLFYIRAVQKFIHIITERPKLVISINLLIILLLALPILQIHINPDLQALIPADDPELLRMEELEEEFGGLDIILISYHTGDVFTAEALEVIDDLTQDLELLPQIDHLISLTNYESIYSEDESMVVNAFISDLPTNQAESDSLALAASLDPMIGQILVSANREYSAFLIFTKPDADEVPTVIVLREVLAPYLAEGHDLQLGGMPVIRTHISEDINRDTLIYIPAGMILIAFLLYFSFRSRRGLLLPMIVVILSILGTLGLMSWLGLMLSVISSIMPIMLIAVASAYGIHIITRYFEDCAAMDESADSKAVVASVVEHMLRPVFLAALTTIIGFLSLLSHILPASREVGVLTAFGVLLAFGLSITLIPAILVLFHKPSRERQNKNTTNRLLSRILVVIARFVFHQRKLVISGFILLTIVALLGIPSVQIDSNPLNYYGPKSIVRVVNTIIDENFGGSTTMSVVIEGDIKSPDVLKQIDAIQSYLDGKDGVGYTMAITDFIKLMNQSMNGGNPEFYSIPDSRELVSQYLLLYSWESSDSYLDAYVDYEYRVAQVVVRMNTMDVYHMVDIQQDLNQFLDANIRVDNQPKSEGYAVLLGNLMPMMVKGQTRSLILSVFLAALVTGLVFRSLVAALISAMPLAFAISGVFGLMGYTGVYLNTATSMLSSIMIGIGIDYTIHFLFRFRTEIRHGLSDEEAIIKTLSTTGQGIIINGFSVIMGFAVCMLSTFIPIYFFGWLIAVSIFMCLIAALTLLPVVLILTRPKFIYG